VRTDQILLCVEQELVKARAKFPSNKHLLHAFQEEAGEVTKAFLDSNQGKADDYAILKELIQTITVGMRLIQEGDPDFPALKPTPEAQR
jgi:hypothetical protein